MLTLTPPFFFFLLLHFFFKQFCCSVLYLIGSYQTSNLCQPYRLIPFFLYSITTHSFYLKFIKTKNEGLLLGGFISHNTLINPEGETSDANFIPL